MNDLVKLDEHEPSKIIQSAYKKTERSLSFFHKYIAHAKAAVYTGCPKSSWNI